MHKVSVGVRTVDGCYVLCLIFCLSKEQAIECKTFSKYEIKNLGITVCFGSGNVDCTKTV